MKSRSTILPLLAILLIAAAPAGAAEDKVVLKTGAVLVGKILEDNADGVVIEIDGLGKIQVPRSQIDKVEGGPGPAPKPEPEPIPGPEPEPVPDPDPGPVPVPVPPVPGPDPVPDDPKVDDPPPPADPVEIPYDKVQPGQTVLVILEGRQDGFRLDAGDRYFAKVSVISPKRVKLVVDPEGGVAGYLWVKREQIRRMIDVESGPERMIMFFEGVEVGSWIEGHTADREEFRGQLAGVTETGRFRVWVPEDRNVETVEIEIGRIRKLSATTAGKELKDRLNSLESGEPLSIRVRGRDEIRGRVASMDRAWLHLETIDEPTGETVERQVFAGLPIVEIRTLPEALRANFRGLKNGEALTVVQVREDEKEIVRRSFTGELQHATTETLGMMTRDGPREFAMASIQSVARPTKSEAAARLYGKQDSEAELAVPIMPGMTREEAEKLLETEPEGLDILCEEGKVVRVFCRPPFSGPVFGIRLGSEFTKALAETDLVFDTQVDPKTGPKPRVSTMVSHTLSSYVVKLYVMKSGAVLAAEITGR